MLERKLHRYFELTETNKFDWVRNPFASSLDHMAFDLSVKEKEELFNLKSDRTLEVEFKDVPLSQFWVTAKKEFPSIGEKAINILLPFATTYMCEQSFSSMLTIKNLKRSLESLHHELRVALSTIDPDIKKYVHRNKRKYLTELRR
jgi:hypothetical protein